MFRKALFLGIISGLLAGLASLIYSHVYHASLGADFSRIAGAVAIVSASLIGGIIAGIGYWVFDKWLKQWGEFVFNLLFVLLSFAVMLPAFGVKLPLDLEAPELFPGLVIPMHFFPALAWFTLKPLFFRQKTP
jgi:hypothetical protein